MIDNDIEKFLEHAGVKGMKWGVRKTNKEARKDAEEFARAKLFYGQGAGTRRKLIKAKVEDRSKRDPEYKKAFDEFLSKQDMSLHANKAQSERSRIDRTDKTKKRAGYIARRFTGEMGTQAAFTAATFAGVAYFNSPKGRATLKNGYNSVSSFINSQQNRRVVSYLEDYFRNQ